MHFDWAENQCTDVNRDYWIGNRNLALDFMVEYSEKGPTGDRITQGPIRIPANRQTKADGLRLGLEEVVGPNGCYDKDFRLEKLWPAKFENYESFDEVSRLARMRLLPEATTAPTAEKLSIARSRAKAIQKFSAEQQLARAKIDCAIECLNAASSNCIRSMPPDQTRLKDTKAYLDGMPAAQGFISNSALLSIFGIAVDSCDRSDSLVRSGRLVNRGQACVYPMLPDQNSNKPSIALHLNELVKPSIARAGDVTTLSFVGDAMMPNLFYRSAALDADYGGRISEIKSTAAGIFYRTQGGACTSMEISK
jgi:hypothetical protein